ncbi:MAG: RidA family protein [Myxococcaceae bacterium]|nr:RidA family protein [Myxococcaceae bacterium]
MSRKVLESSQAPKAIGPYSQAISVERGTMIFCSGQIPLDPRSGQLVTGDIRKETEQVLANLKAVLEAGGASFAHVVRCTIYLTDMNDFTAVNEVYGRAFTSAPPARATVAVAALPKGARVEIDAIAVT